MGYRHIENLYKNQGILAFKECFALEKLHGTSTSIQWRDGKLQFSSGGAKAERFRSLFDEAALVKAFEALGHPTVVVYGEAYGGSQQKQTWRYGKDLKFAAFEVKIDDTWLSVENAHNVATKLSLEFVHYERIAATVEEIDKQRDAPSVQAVRNGIEEPQPREGVVLRPLTEYRDHRGERVLSKHKRDEERETNTPRQVVDPEKLKVLEEAQAIADEWVTPTRLEHVLDKIEGDIGMERTKEVIQAMTEDVLREGAGEIVDSKEARKAIGSTTAKLFKKYFQAKLQAQ